MHTLQLKLKQQAAFRPIVRVNGKNVKLKKNEFGHYMANIQVEQPEAEISVYTVPNELTYKHWFWMSMLFFIVSVFGIFDSWKIKSNDYSLSYKGKINVLETSKLELVMEKPTPNGKALTAKEGAFEDNESNVYTFHKEVKKRKRILIATKVACWVVAVIVLVICLV